jgi:hypothetical protein
MKESNIFTLNALSKMTPIQQEDWRRSLNAYIADSQDKKHSAAHREQSAIGAGDTLTRLLKHLDGGE